jgi:hypothetical protein
LITGQLINASFLKAFIQIFWLPYSNIHFVFGVDGLSMLSVDSLSAGVFGTVGS